MVRVIADPCPSNDPIRPRPQNGQLLAEAVKRESIFVGKAVEQSIRHMENRLGLYQADAKKPRRREGTVRHVEIGLKIPVGSVADYHEVPRVQNRSGRECKNIRPARWSCRLQSEPCQRFRVLPHVEQLNPLPAHFASRRRRNRQCRIDNNPEKVSVIQRIGAQGDFPTVRVTVAVRINALRVGVVNKDFSAVGQPVAVGILPIRHGIKPYPRVAGYIRVLVHTSAIGQNQISRQTFPRAFQPVKRWRHLMPMDIGAGDNFIVFIGPNHHGNAGCVPDGIGENLGHVRSVRHRKQYVSAGQTLHIRKAELSRL